MTKIVVFGAGKIADVLYTIALADRDVSLAGFTCDRAYVTAPELHGLPLVPFEEVETAFPPTNFAMFVAIGTRRSIRSGRNAAARRAKRDIGSFR